MMQRAIVFCFLVSSAMGLVVPIAVRAQESLTLEVTPPLFRVSISPGGEWSSQLKVVNPNPFPITVATRIADYERFGDRPGGELISRRDIDGAERFSASQWLDISAEAFIVPAESSRILLFSLVVPDDAEPGTHTAAVVIGIVPKGTEAQVQTQISASVTSIIVVSILGDAVISGEIVAFSTGEKSYPTTSADFLLEFANTGEVHVEPLGEVIITNLWGTERGRIPVTVEEDLRLVLPGEHKAFRFLWRGEGGAFDVGPYRARVRIQYGGENELGDIQEATASLWFWVVPWKQILIVVVGLLLFAFLLVLGIRSVISKILIREAMSRRVQPFDSLPPGALEHARPNLVAGGKQGVIVDLRKSQSDEPGAGMFGNKGARSPIVLVALGLAGIFTLAVAVLYITSVVSKNTTYTIGIPEEDGIRVVSEDELFRLAQSEPLPGTEILAVPPQEEEDVEVAIEVRVLVQNGSGIPGKAAEVSARLRDAGFSTVTSENADSFDYGRTVIRYKQGRGAIVEEIRDLLGLDPIIEEKEDLLEEVVLIIGQDIR